MENKTYEDPFNTFEEIVEHIGNLTDKTIQTLPQTSTDEMRHMMGYLFHVLQVFGERCTSVEEDMSISNAQSMFDDISYSATYALMIALTQLTKEHNELTKRLERLERVYNQ